MFGQDTTYDRNILLAHHLAHPTRYINHFLTAISKCFGYQVYSYIVPETSALKWLVKYMIAKYLRMKNG